MARWRGSAWGSYEDGLKTQNVKVRESLGYFKLCMFFFLLGYSLLFFLLSFLLFYCSIVFSFCFYRFSSFGLLPQLLLPHVYYLNSLFTTSHIIINIIASHPHHHNHRHITITVTFITTTISYKEASHTSFPNYKWKYK